MMFGDVDEREAGTHHQEPPPRPAAARHAGQGADEQRRAGNVMPEAPVLRANAPTTQEQRTDEVESPPLYDDNGTPGGEDGAPPPRGRRRQWRVLAFALLGLVPLAAVGYLYWDNVDHFQSTDDAFIAARSFSIEPEVSGYITAVPVTDNQHVAAGAVIARIDDRNYRVALDKAKAQLAHDQAVLRQAQMDLTRYQGLLRQNSIAGQQAQDQVYVAQQDQANVALDQANVDAAQLDLDHTVVTADQAGRVVNLTGAVGQYAQAGTALTMLVPDQTWVTANFKETQLDRMRTGQPVSLRIDAYTSAAVRGHVASVQPGSGPAFSLLPPENATGNWVKIVQRVPVKIVMDNPPPGVALGPGMSVEATVRVDPGQPLYQRLEGLLGARSGRPA